MSQDDKTIRRFDQFFANLDGGDAHTFATEELDALTKKLRDEALRRGTKVSGSVNISIAISADEKGQVDATCSVKRTEPAKKGSASRYWVTDEGRLSYENPRQLSLKPRAVESPTEAPRDVSAEQ